MLKTMRAPQSTTVELQLPYPRVSGNHSVRHARSGAHYLTEEAREYHDAVARVVCGRRAPDGLLQLDWLIAPPDSRARDFDNLAKVVKDALTRAGFWADDSNKVIGRGSWEWVTSPVKGGVVHVTVSRAG